MRSESEGRSAHVAHAPHSNALTRKRPKSRRSERRIALAPSVVEALGAHRLRQLQARHTLGPAWTDTDLVFCDEIGCELSADRIRFAFQKLLKTAGLPRIRFHDLRHTAATILLGRRVNPKIVSEMLGQASISITLDIYSHVLPDMQQDAAAIMHTVLAHAPRSSPDPNRTPNP